MMRAVATMLGLVLMAHVTCAAALAAADAAKTEPAKSPAAAPAKPAPAEPADKIMGEYVGTMTHSVTVTAGIVATATATTPAEAKVIAEGGGNYRAVVTISGITTPSLAIDGLRYPLQLSGKADGNKVALAGKGGDIELKGVIDGGKTLVAESSNGVQFELKYTVHHSPTEGEKPPAGAVVLLPFAEGKPPTLDEWAAPAWKPQDDGSVVSAGADMHTNRKFGDFQLHVEFRVPLEPAGRGQGRGNSGIYLQDLYEMQVLDSFGLPPDPSECAAVYTQVPPTANACFPPGSWQTYDITFRAPRFDADGKKTKDAVVTIMHNGVKVQDSTVIHGPTGAAKGRPEAATGVIRLQFHGHGVRFRNMWLVETKE